jgi:hypothetical protein
MLEIIEDQLESAQKNLAKAEDEPLSLVVNFIGEEPWDELWPNCKNHFYKMDMNQLLALAEFYHILIMRTLMSFLKRILTNLR